jgi:hypothetical protein
MYTAVYNKEATLKADCECCQKHSTLHEFMISLKFGNFLKWFFVGLLSEV